MKPWECTLYTREILQKLCLNAADFFFFFKSNPGMVAQTGNPRTQELEAGESP